MLETSRAAGECQYVMAPPSNEIKMSDDGRESASGAGKVN